MEPAEARDLGLRCALGAALLVRPRHRVQHQCLARTPAADRSSAARAHLAEFGIRDASIVRTARDMAQPSTGWETGMPTKLDGAAAVDAWGCEFWAGARNCLVYVDAASGRVVGGEFREVQRALAPGLG